MSEGGATVVYPELSYKIVGILFEVHNELGYGYQEMYYQKAVERSLLKNNINFKSQCPFSISSKGEIIGRYFLDFLIEDKIILEIKKGDHFAKRNFEQVLAYLKHTDMQLAILTNFTSGGVKYKRLLNIKKDKENL